MVVLSEAELKQHVDVLLRDFVRYQGGPLLVFADGNTQDIAAQVVGSALSMKGLDENSDPVVYNVDGLRTRYSLTDGVPKKLKAELDEKLSAGRDENHRTVLFIAHPMPEEGKFRSGIRALGEEYGKMGGLPGCTHDVLVAGFSPKNIPKFGDELFAALSDEEEFIVTCDRGTMLKTGVNPREYRLVNSNGVLVPYKYGNPIMGEIFLHPEYVKGKLVITGSYAELMKHDRFKGKYRELVQALDETPLTMTIDGKVLDVKCDDKYIEEIARRYVFDVDTEHGMKIGELGFPTNLFVLNSLLTGNLLLDEKGRVHVAHGDGYQNRTGCKYTSEVHGDGLLANASVFAMRRNDWVMRNNVYNPAYFPSLKAA